MSVSKTDFKHIHNSFVFRLFINVVIIMILSCIVSSITNFTDGIVASRLISDNASAALTVATPPIIFLGVFETTICVGTEIICSQKMAKGEIDEAKKVFSFSILFTLLIGIIFFFILFFAGNNLAMLCGAENEEIANLTGYYLKGLAIGSPFIILNSTLMPLANLDGSKKLTYASVIAILIVNVVGDVLSGLFFNGKDAIFGIGLSTSLSFVVGTLILSIHFLSKKTKFKFTFKGIFNKNDSKMIFAGLPNGYKATLIFIRSTILNNIMLSIGGTMILTAFSVQSHFTPFIEAFMAGLMSTCLTLGNVFYAEEDEEALDQLVSLVFKFSFTVVLTFSILYFALAEQLVSLYGVGGSIDDPESKKRLIEMSVFAIRCDALTVPFISINCCILAIMLVAKKNKLSYIMTTLQSFVIPLVFVPSLGYPFGEEGIFIAYSGSFVLFTFVYLIFTFIRNKKISIKARNLFFLPKDFGYYKGKNLTITIKNIVDALDVADKIIDFGKENEIDNRRCYHLAACTEELAVMTVLSGFTKDGKKNHLVEIKILFKNNSLTLRVRDDCKKFNITEKSQRFYDPENPTRNLAIRIIMGLAKKVEYTNLLKTNNLIISF